MPIYNKAMLLEVSGRWYEKLVDDPEGLRWRVWYDLHGDDYAYISDPEKLLLLDELFGYQQAQLTKAEAQMCRDAFRGERKRLQGVIDELMRAGSDFFVTAAGSVMISSLCNKRQAFDELEYKLTYGK